MNNKNMQKISKIKNFLNKKININGTWFIIFCLIYIYMSIFIFLLGWIKPLISIPTSILLLLFIIKYIKNRKKEKISIFISVKSIILLIFSLSLFGILLGWSGTFAQSGDWYKHNAILSDLTKKSWPIYYKNGHEESMLTYYIGQYLFPSLIGKIFSSIRITQLVNCFWAIIGLFIATIGIFKITKSNTKEKQIISFLITILFSVCLPLSQNIGKIIAPNLINSSGYWISFTDNIRLQLSSNPVLLRWVMPQVIIPWITLCILFDDPHDRKNYMLIFLPVIFYSTLPFIGIIAVLLIFSLLDFIKEKKKLLFIKDILSISNVTIFITLAFILLSYFYGNIFLKKPDYIGISFINYSKYIIVYFAFILTFIPYTIILFKNNYKNSFYWISTLMLFLIPFVNMGLYNDFVMRVSIIPLFIYMILIIKTLYNVKVTKLKKIILIIFLIISSYSSMSEISNCFELNKNKKITQTLETTANRKLKDVTEDVKYNYYSYNIKKNFFHKYIAKRKIKD